MEVSRRDFLASGALAVGTTALASTRVADANMVLAQAIQPAPRGFNPADPALKYDLVIANADVLDPAQQLRGRRDIGIKHGQIAALVNGSIPADRSTHR
jgi:adenine deaminase